MVTGLGIHHRPWVSKGKSCLFILISRKFKKKIDRPPGSDPPGCSARCLLEAIFRNFCYFKVCFFVCSFECFFLIQAQLVIPGYIWIVATRSGHHTRIQVTAGGRAVQVKSETFLFSKLHQWFLHKNCLNRYNKVENYIEGFNLWLWQAPGSLQDSGGQVLEDQNLEAYQFFF